MVQGKHYANIDVFCNFFCLYYHLFLCYSLSKKKKKKAENNFLKSLQAVIDPPPGDKPVGLDMLPMGKGLAWLNGEEIGRYWPRKSSTHQKCVHECDYRGKFMPDKCFTGCGEPTQRW